MNFLQTIESGNLPEIEQALSERLAKNSSFFKEFHPNIFAIMTREPQKYVLVVNEEDINIYNFIKEEFVYPKNSMIEASKRLAQNPLNNPIWKISNNNMVLTKISELDFPQTGAIVNTIIEQAMKRESLEQNSLHLPNGFLPSTTIFGMGSGLFLEYLCESMEYIHSLLIFEEVVDFFRISCCFVDYPKLFSKVTPNSCFLFVENIIDRKVVKYFFSRHKITSNFIRLSLKMYESPKIDEVQKIVELEQNSNSRGWGSFEDEMNGIKNALKNINIQNSSLKIQIMHTKKKVNIPICVVGNGPSLDELLPFIKENHEKMIIFSAGTAIRPLRNYGVKPDFQIEIERMPYLPRVLRESNIDGVTLLCAHLVNSGVLEFPNEKLIFMRGSASSGYAYSPKLPIEFTYPFVGNAAFSLALHFSDTILLCGLDAGYKKGRTKHAKGSFYGEEEAKLPNGVVPVKGNFSDDIFADSIFAHSREVMEIAILNMKPKIVLNLSDGAYIKGTTPSRAENITLAPTNKEPKLKEIKRCFSKNKKEVFARADTDDMIEYFDWYKDELFKILGRGVKTKKELFMVIDDAIDFTQKVRNEKPYIGVLLGGSVSHILHTLFLLSFYIRRNDIEAIYKELLYIFKKGFDGFFARYRITMLLAQNG